MEALTIGEIDAAWWESQHETMQLRMMDFDWQDHGMPAMREFAAKFPRRSAFVFGTGPSLDGVTPGQWAALSEYFSVGVNGAPVKIQDATGRFDVPKVGFATDIRKFTCHKMDAYARGFQAMRDHGLKVVVGVGAYQFPHTHTIAVCGSPHPDLRFGLPITISGKVRFNRAICPAIHMCFQLGFKDVYLLGIDHIPGYQEDPEEDTRRANEALAAYAEEWCKPRGLGLYECGEKTHVRSIPFRNLNEVLNASDDIQAVAGQNAGCHRAPAFGDGDPRLRVAVPA